MDNDGDDDDDDDNGDDGTEMKTASIQNETIIIKTPTWMASKSEYCQRY